MPALGLRKNKKGVMKRSCLASADYKCIRSVAPEKPHRTASGRHRTAIRTQFMLWKQRCQAALSLTLSCDNPSSVIHKPLLFGAGKDIKAILIQPVGLSSQDGGVGNCSSTTCCWEIGCKKDEQPTT